MGIVDLEPRVGEVVGVIDFTAIQPLKTISRYDHSGGSGFHDLVPGHGLGHVHFILPTGTTATAHGQPETRLRGLRTAGEQLAEFGDGFGCEGDHGRCDNLGAARGFETGNLKKLNHHHFSGQKNFAASGDPPHPKCRW